MNGAQFLAGLHKFVATHAQRQALPQLKLTLSPTGIGYLAAARAFLEEQLQQRQQAQQQAQQQRQQQQLAELPEFHRRDLERWIAEARALLGYLRQLTHLKVEKPADPGAVVLDDTPWLLRISPGLVDKSRLEPADPVVDLRLFPGLTLLHLVDTGLYRVENLAVLADRLGTFLVRDSPGLGLRSVVMDLLRAPRPDQDAPLQGPPGWKDLRYLMVRRCGLSQTAEADVLELLDRVEILDLSYNQLTSVQGFEHCTNLRALDLGFNQIADLSRANLHIGNLSTLILQNNQIADIGALGKLYSLRKLDLSYNRLDSLANIEPLSRLPELQAISLVGNPLALMPGYRAKVSALFVSRMEAGPFVLDGQRLQPQEIRAAQQLAPQLLRSLQQRRTGLGPQPIGSLSGGVGLGTPGGLRSAVASPARDHSMHISSAVGALGALIAPPGSLSSSAFEAPRFAPADLGATAAASAAAINASVPESSYNSRSADLRQTAEQLRPKLDPLQLQGARPAIVAAPASAGAAGSPPMLVIPGDQLGSTGGAAAAPVVIPAAAAVFLTEPSGPVATALPKKKAPKKAGGKKQRVILLGREETGGGGSSYSEPVGGSMPGASLTSSGKLSKKKKARAAAAAAAAISEVSTAEEPEHNESATATAAEAPATADKQEWIRRVQAEMAQQMRQAAEELEELQQLQQQQQQSQQLHEQSQLTQVGLTGAAPGPAGLSMGPTVSSGLNTGLNTGLSSTSSSPGSELQRALQRARGSDGRPPENPFAEPSPRSDSGNAGHDQADDSHDALDAGDDDNRSLEAERGRGDSSVSGGADSTADPDSSAARRLAADLRQLSVGARGGGRKSDSDSFSVISSQDDFVHLNSARGTSAGGTHGGGLAAGDGHRHSISLSRESQRSEGLGSDFEMLQSTSSAGVRGSQQLRQPVATAASLVQPKGRRLQPADLSKSCRLVAERIFDEADFGSGLSNFRSLSLSPSAFCELDVSTAEPMETQSRWCLTAFVIQGDVLTLYCQPDPRFVRSAADDEDAVAAPDLKELSYQVSDRDDLRVVENLLNELSMRQAAPAADGHDEHGAAALLHPLNHVGIFASGLEDDAAQPSSPQEQRQPPFSAPARSNSPSAETVSDRTPDHVSSEQLEDQRPQDGLDQGVDDSQADAPATKTSPLLAAAAFAQASGGAMGLMDEDHFSPPVAAESAAVLAAALQREAEHESKHGGSSFQASRQASLEAASGGDDADGHEGEAEDDYDLALVEHQKPAGKKPKRKPSKLSRVRVVPGDAAAEHNARLEAEVADSLAEGRAQLCSGYRAHFFGLQLLLDVHEHDAETHVRCQTNTNWLKASPGKQEQPWRQHSCLLVVTDTEVLLFLHEDRSDLSFRCRHHLNTVHTIMFGIQDLYIRIEGRYGRHILFSPEGNRDLILDVGSAIKKAFDALPFEMKLVAPVAAGSGKKPKKAKKQRGGGRSGAPEGTPALLRVLQFDRHAREVLALQILQPFASGSGSGLGGGLGGGPSKSGGHDEIVGSMVGSPGAGSFLSGLAVGGAGVNALIASVQLYEYVYVYQQSLPGQQPPANQQQQQQQQGQQGQLEWSCTLDSVHSDDDVPPGWRPATLVVTADRLFLLHENMYAYDPLPEPGSPAGSEHCSCQLPRFVLLDQRPLSDLMRVDVSQAYDPLGQYTGRCSLAFKDGLVFRGDNLRTWVLGIATPSPIKLLNSLIKL